MNTDSDKQCLTKVSDTGMTAYLYDKHDFCSAITQRIAENKPLSIMIFQIDDLSLYSFGNTILEILPKEILNIIQDDFQLFSLETDGFGLLYTGMGYNMLSKAYNQILSLSQNPRKINGLAVSFSISAGICSYPNGGDSYSTLYSNAKLALTEARRGLKKCCVHYTSSLSEQTDPGTILLDKLRMSVENNFEGFSLVFQPIIRTKTKELDGCEALLRWENPAFPDGISPYYFVPVLESSGLILKVGKWVIETALAQCAKWHKIMPNFQMSINVSAKQFNNADFTPFVLDTILKYSINPTTIILELTESGRADFASLQQAFRLLRKQGIKTAIDDFGTGYASLDIFRSLSTDELKIDRSFLERIVYDVTDQILLRTIIEMCKKMNIIVCVEGIENSEIEQVVSEMEPNLLQGFLYNRPMRVLDFQEKYIRESTLAPTKKEKLSAFLYTELRPVQALPAVAIINQAHAGIFQVGLDTDLTLLTCNEGFRRLLGYTSKQMEEKFTNQALQFIHPNDRQWANDEIRRQLGRGDIIRIEWRVIRSDGSVVWIVGTGNIVRDLNGLLSLIIVVLDNDATKRKILARYTQCDVYEKILQKFPIRLRCRKGDDGYVIEYIADALLSFLGYTREEMASDFDNRYINFVHEEDRAYVNGFIAAQCMNGFITSFRYRAICKNGNILWLENISKPYYDGNDGVIRWCACVIIHNELCCDNLAFSLRDKDPVECNYDCATQKMVFTNNFIKKFGYNLSDVCVEHLDAIYEDDREVLCKVLNGIKIGEPVTFVEVRILTPKNMPLWCRFALSSKEHSDGKVTSIGGVVNSIDQKDGDQEYLMDKFQIDSLTAILNKNALELHITDTIAFAFKQKYALWMIDIDNFKVVNDTHGHFIGDKVLKVVAKRLINAFREVDIVGRSGGDEFMIFMRYTSDELLHEKAANVLKLLCAPIALGDNIVCNITFSLGISCYPKDADTFSGLFQKADAMIYRAKKEGKTTFFVVN